MRATPGRDGQYYSRPPDPSDRAPAQWQYLIAFLFPGVGIQQECSSPAQSRGLTFPKLGPDPDLPGKSDARRASGGVSFQWFARSAGRSLLVQPIRGQCEAQQAG